MGKNFWGVLSSGWIALLSLSLAPASQAGFKTDFQVDLGRYAGLWYEFARTPNENQDNTPRRGGKQYGACFNTTAEYKVEDPTTISLRNNCFREAADKSTITDPATGYAIAVEGSGNRKLQLAFGSSGLGRFIQRSISGGGFDYWIYCLGRPAAGPYDYAVVSGPGRDFIFVLTRTKSFDPARRAEAEACMRAEGLPLEKLIYQQR